MVDTIAGVQRSMGCVLAIATTPGATLILSHLFTQE